MLCSKQDYGTISSKHLKHRKLARRNCQAHNHGIQPNGYTAQEGKRWLSEDSSTPKLSQSLTRETTLEDSKASDATVLKENGTIVSYQVNDAAVTMENGTVTSLKENDAINKNGTVISHKETNADIPKENGIFSAHTENLNGNIEEKAVPVFEKEGDVLQEDNNKTDASDLVEDSGTSSVSQGKSLGDLDCTQLQTASMEQPIVVTSI